MRRRGSARGKTRPPASASDDRVDSHPRHIRNEQAQSRVLATFGSPLCDRRGGTACCSVLVLIGHHAPRTRRRPSPPRPSAVRAPSLAPPYRPSGGAAAIRCGLAGSAAAVNRRRRSPAAAAVAERQDEYGDEPSNPTCSWRSCNYSKPTRRRKRSCRPAIFRAMFAGLPRRHCTDDSHCGPSQPFRRSIPDSQARRRACRPTASPSPHATGQVGELRRDAGR